MQDRDVRLAIQDDRCLVEGIVSAAYSHYAARIGREPGPMSDDYSVLIAKGSVYVVNPRGTVAGVLVLIPQDDALLLDNIAVAPDAQGQGLGRRLLRFAEHTALDAGYSVIKLYTNEAMTENLSLYSRIGYCETHRATQNGLRRVYMQKRLCLE